VYLDPTDAGVRSLLERNTSGPVVMLNLLRLRDRADYSTHPELAPAKPISGSQAYQKYIDHTKPYLAATGGGILLLAAGGHHFIGPPEERWDVVMLVQQTSVQDFLAFASNEGYLAGTGHRVAAVEDSRLLPVSLPRLADGLVNGSML
jgi:hypothetical protein